MIRASMEHVFSHLVPPEAMARYGGPLWMVAEVVEKRGGAQLVSLRGYFAGLPAEFLLRVSSRAPSSLEFTQVLGTLRAFSGRCTLRSGEDGVEVAYRIDADPGIAMMSDAAARQFLVQFLERMLDRIKHASERKSPGRRLLAKGTAVSTTLGEAAAPDEEPLDFPEVHAREDGHTSSASPPDGTREAPAGGHATQPPAVPQPSPPVAGPRPRPRHPGDAARSASHVARPGPGGQGPAAPPPAAGEGPGAATPPRKRRRRRRGRRGGTGGAPPPPAAQH